MTKEIQDVFQTLYKNIWNYSQRKRAIDKSKCVYTIAVHFATLIKWSISAPAEYFRLKCGRMSSP